MAELILEPVPLTPERFAPYGDVIETSAHVHEAMNEARFERFGVVREVRFPAGEHVEHLRGGIQPHHLEPGGSQREGDPAGADTHREPSAGA